MSDIAQTVLRMPTDTFEQLRDRYAETYATHRLSFNLWLLSRIQLSFLVEEERHAVVVQAKEKAAL